MSSSSDDEVGLTSDKQLKGQNLCVGTDLSTSEKQLIRAAGGVATTSVTHLTTLVLMERGAVGRQVDLLVAQAQQMLRKSSKRKIEVIDRAGLILRYPGLPKELHPLKEGGALAPPADFHTAQTRKLVSLVADRAALASQRVAFVSVLVFDVTEDVPLLEVPVAPAASTVLERVAGPLRRSLATPHYYQPNLTELLISAAGGRFSADIDGNVTIVVTGMAHAGEAMDAAVGKHDRYTLALRQKVNTDRPGGPLKVMDAVAFLEAYGLLDAARFLLPLAPPKSGRECEVLELPDLLLKSSDEILAATSSTGGDGSGQPGSTAAPSSATGGSGASGGASAALSFGAIKAEKLQTVGLAVPVAVAGAASGFGGAASMLTAEERNFAKYLPPGIGKPFAGRTFTLLGGCFDMGDLGRVLDVVAKGADLVYRFDLYLGPNSEIFGNLLKYLGARVTKQLSGNTTHALYGHDDHMFGSKPKDLEAQIAKGSKRPGGVLKKLSITQLAIEFGLAPVLLHTGWGNILGDRTRFMPIPGLTGCVSPVLPEEEPLPDGVCKRGKSKGAAELHFAKLKGWVPPGAAAAADQWMASHFMLVSDHAGHKQYIFQQELTHQQMFFMGMGDFAADGGGYDDSEPWEGQGGAFLGFGAASGGSGSGAPASAAGVKAEVPSPAASKKARLVESGSTDLLPVLPAIDEDAAALVMSVALPGAAGVLQGAAQQSEARAESPTVGAKRKLRSGGGAAE